MKRIPTLLLVLLAITAPLRAADHAPRVIPQVVIGGSTLDDVVKYLREAGAVNIVLTPSLMELPAPDLTLANVTAEGVLNSYATMMPQISVQTVTDSSGTQIINVLPARNRAAKVCRVFKASAKEKLQGAQLEQLIKNLADAAKLVCDANARAQGRKDAELPTIEAHPPTGILIVTGEESDVQLLGQVVQALGGEVVPLTDPKPAVLNLPNGATGTMMLPKGITLNVSSQIEQANKQMEQAGQQIDKAAKQVDEALKQITIQVKAADKK